MSPNSTHALRGEIATFLEMDAPPEQCEFVVEERVHEEGYTRSAGWFCSPSGEAVQAFLFEPLAEHSGGAVLALHQHNSQWEIGKSEIAGLMGDPLQAFGPALSRRGVVVLAPDLPGFESRCGPIDGGVDMAPPLSRPHSTPEGWLQYYNHGAHRLVRGELLMTTILTDLMAGVSLLRGCDGVDPNRVGVLGHSHGGNVALFLGALDTRLAFACSSGAVCSYRHKLAVGTGLEMALVIPGFAFRFDFDHLAACVAPRHLLVVSSEDDPFSADAGDVVARARPTFENFGCGNHLSHIHVGVGHALDAERFESIVEWAVVHAASVR